MLSRLRRPGALPALMMFVIILWALLAVFMLTNTLVDARHIENRVEVINGEVAPIDKELDNVKLAGEVADATDQIRPAAAPLTGQLTTTNEHVVKIDASAERILATAGQINATAKEINGTVGQINTNVGTIGATLNSVEASALSIGDSVDGINGSFAGTLSEVVSIDDHLVTANAQVDTLLGQVETIGANVANVTEVQVPAIMTNAEGIENSPLLLKLGESGVINQMAAARAAEAAGPQSGPLPVQLPLPDALPVVPELGLPAPSLGEALPLAPQWSPQHSPENDTGSILGGLLGGF